MPAHLDEGGNHAPAQSGITQKMRGEKPAAFSMRVYHGSPQSDLGKIKAFPEERQYDNATSQFGAFFSPSPTEAKRYAGNGRVYPADLKLSKPYEMPTSLFQYYQSPHKDAEGRSLPGEKWNDRAGELKQEASSYRRELQKLGHDGVIIRNTRGDPIEVSSFKDVPVGYE
jgi:hypothetical protein